MKSGPFFFGEALFVQTERGWWRSDDDGISWFLCDTPSVIADLTAERDALAERVRVLTEWLRADAEFWSCDPYGDCSDEEIVFEYSRSRDAARAAVEQEG